MPDLPGSVTEGDALEEIEPAVREAATGWMEAERDAGAAIPKASSVERYADEDDYAGCAWFVVEPDDEAELARTL